jgi:purine-cytosine permease-like protein
MEDVGNFIVSVSYYITKMYLLVLAHPYIMENIYSEEVKKAIDNHIELISLDVMRKEDENNWLYIIGCVSNNIAKLEDYINRPMRSKDINSPEIVELLSILSNMKESIGL